MTRRARIIAGLAIVAVPLAALAGAGAVVWRSIDPGAVKARLIAEVQHRTGRELSLGSLQLHFLPDLRVDADSIALANPAGFSRPAMLTADQLTAHIALLPLLRRRVIVTDLTLRGADLDLERPADGPPNWVFATGKPSASLPHPAPALSLPRLRLDRVTLLGLTYDGMVGWHLPQGSGSVPITRLTLREVNDSSTISLALDAALSGERVQVAGQFGGQDHLWHRQDISPWPVTLKLISDDGTITLGGALTQPDELSGYDITLDAAGRDLGALFTSWPGLKVPRLSDLHLSTRLIDRPDGIDIPRLALAAGPSDLSALVDGLSLDALAIAAPNIDGGNGTQRNRIDATGRYAGQALTVKATVGPIGRLLGHGQTQARSPIALDAAVQAAGADLSVQGRVAPTGDWSGTDATLTAHIPDLSLLAPLAARPLPQWQNIALHFAARAHDGRLDLTGVSLAAPQATLTGNASAWLAGRPRYEAQVHATQLDLGALAAAVRAARIGGPFPSASPATPDPPTAEAQDAWIIPDRKLADVAPAGFDADVTLNADAARLNGVALSNLSAHAVLAAGHLVIAPLAAGIGTARASGRISVDDSASPPGYALTLHAAGLDATQVLGLLGLGPAARGQVDLDASLTATGDTPHAMAATLDGHLGIAFTDGAIDNGLLTTALNHVTPAAHFGFSLPTQGQSEVACLAAALDIRQGVAVPSVLLLSTKRLRLAAAGAVDLGQETFALRLRPYIVLGGGLKGTGLILPSRANGPWQAPRLTLEAATGAASAASLAAGLVAPQSPLGVTLADLAGSSDTALALADSGDCTRAVAEARGTDGTPPGAAPPPAEPSRKKHHSAFDLLKQLFKQVKP